ncbi:unnamed protein product [Caenorhabditis angaria]|uniref:SCP domain-containing protein n=1 Tax=Caenorhabditis angaria TaxID=860376 RepID=A0A9P1ILM8_9PELO|nr:unnamed protein product [Caenorhabditis angaria]
MFMFIFIFLSIFGATNSLKPRCIAELVELLNQERQSAVYFYQVANMRKLIYSTRLESDALNATIPFMDFQVRTSTEYPSPRSPTILHHQSLRIRPFIFDDAFNTWFEKLARKVPNFDQTNPKILTREWKRRAPEYFQIIWPEAFEIGCVHVTRPDLHLFLACSFDASPVIDQHIFETGPPCSKCPRGMRCDHGLCM